MKHQALIAAGLLTLVMPFTARAAPPEEPAESIVCRGMSGVGFSYAWGGECWCGNGCTPDLSTCSPGVCTPTGSDGCPDCTHSGKYGADCSGFVSKAWQVPQPYAVEACGVDRYVASSFTSNHSYWSVVPMSSLKPADAAASSSHVVLVVGPKDSHGQYEVVEAKGCNYGIVHQNRTFSSSYSGARRINITSCVCNDGDEETRGCGDCGTQKRTCQQGCLWSDWSPCEGPDPAESTCTVAGATGQCAEGKRLCVAGWLTCQAVAASTEVCDGVDNDCDGIVDNGTPETLGEGIACTTSCGEGKSACVDGVVRCISEGCGSEDAGLDSGPMEAGLTEAGPTEPEPEEPDPTEADSGVSKKPGSQAAANAGEGGDGCGCRITSAVHSAAWAAPLLLLGLLGMRRRRAD